MRRIIDERLPLAIDEQNRGEPSVGRALVQTPEEFRGRTGRNFTLSDLDPPRLPTMIYTLYQLDAPFFSWLSREPQQPLRGSRISLSNLCPPWPTR